MVVPLVVLSAVSMVEKLAVCLVDQKADVMVVRWAEW